ncbi:MAG TPA: ureidoglycolate lyase [Patescibacteria group bacterium]|nr:ureidoglycolate lyase [Patescibacteria group bacterium]
MKYNLKKITKKNFRRYGWVIACPCAKPKDKSKSHFCIVRSENAKTGWRIAYLLLREKAVGRMERHPDTFESFEPMSGKSLICVARKKDAADITWFFLDKPVILNKGVWHGLLTRTPESEIKITENAKVGCVYWPLAKALAPK